MPSRFETIMTALKALLEAATPATVDRGGGVPTAVPAAGLVVLVDGEPGTPEVTLSPLTWHFEHVAAVEIYSTAANRDVDLDAGLDAIRVAIGTAIAADRTLGGLCDWIEAEAPATETLPLAGGAPTKAAIIPIRLFYATTDPLI